MGHDQDDQEQDKHQNLPEKEQMKRNFSETTFETYHDARSHRTPEPRRLVLNKHGEKDIFFG